jgi:hypothetical protein
MSPDVTPRDRVVDPDGLYEALVRTKARLEPGLAEAELDAIEQRFGFEFPPDLWMMLSLALPLDSKHSRGWTDWRHGSDEMLRDKLSWPTEGLLAHVSSGDLWWEGWGPRPSPSAEAEAVARRALRELPQLVPVRSHHYVSSAPAQPGNAILLCHETDVFVCSADLVDFLDGGCSKRISTRRGVRSVPFWSEFVASRRS